MKQLEEKFLNEIKPLVNQFIEIRKQPLDIKQRMECVDIRKEIQAKTSEFKKAYTEMSSREWERIEAENARINAQHINIIKNMVQLKQDIVLRDTAIKEAKREGKDDDTYKLLCITQKTEIEKFSKMKQQCEKGQEIYKSNIGQLEELKKAQKEFEEKYGDMDYITEKEMYRLDSFMGFKEDMETVRMSSSQVYDENGKVLDMENIMDMEQKADEELKQDKEKELEQLREKVSKMFDEKQKEFDTYWEQKMRDFDEVEAKVDEELREEARQKKLNMQEDKKEQDVPKKGRIRRLWEKAKSFFKRKVIPALIEPIEQEPEETDTFKKELTKDSPPPEKQAENSKKFINRGKNKKTEKEIKEVLTLLD